MGQGLGAMLVCAGMATDTSPALIVASAFGAFARWRERGGGFANFDIGGSAPDTPAVALQTHLLLFFRPFFLACRSCLRFFLRRSRSAALSALMGSGA